jgi:hypothetical protein
LANGTRFRRIDDQNRGDHFNLTAADECYFLREYTSGKSYTFGETNNLISNLKKKPSQSGTRGYRYKTAAIEQCAREISVARLRREWLRIGTLVPMPPSKARGHPDYDDRIAQICRAIRTDPPTSIDVRELVVQTKSLDAAHEITGSRPTVDDLLRVYAIDETLVDPSPQAIAVVDDVLTAGTHFAAMKRILNRRFTDIPVAGIFIARRVFPDPFAAVPTE